MWSEWKRTTRFVSSVRLALARETQLWSSLELEEDSPAVIDTTLGTSQYRVNLDAHLNAIKDEHLLCAMALLYSYAVAEAAVAEKLGRETDALGQVEARGRELLVAATRDWADVLDGKTGIVEVAVVRNALAHGCSTYEQRHHNRVASAGHAPTWNVGDPIILTFETLKSYRSRLKSLVRMGEASELTEVQIAELRHDEK